MKKIFNKDGFIWFIGVVEDRIDPLKLGRCRVRIYGYHTDDKSEQPTEDLPWAVPIQPITSAATSGVGSTPLGPIEGTWVVGFYLDGNDMQQPTFFGTISTKAAPLTFKEVIPTIPPSQVSNSETGETKDENNNVVKDALNNKVLSGNTPVQGASEPETAAISSGLIPFSVDYISDYKTTEDPKGAQYGLFALASFLPAKTPGGVSRQSAKNSPLSSFLKQSAFSVQFAGLIPGTEEFDTKWLDIASSDAFLFEREQKQYFEKSFFNGFVSSLKRKNGLDINNFSGPVKNLAFSTALQSGASATSLFTKPLDGKTVLNNEDILDVVTEYRINAADSLFKSQSPSFINDIKSSLNLQKASVKGLLPKLNTDVLSTLDIPAIPTLDDLQNKIPKVDGTEIQSQIPKSPGAFDLDR